MLLLLPSRDAWEPVRDELCDETDRMHMYIHTPKYNFHVWERELSTCCYASDAVSEQHPSSVKRFRSLHGAEQSVDVNLVVQKKSLRKEIKAKISHSLSIVCICGIRVVQRRRFRA